MKKLIAILMMIIMIFSVFAIHTVSNAADDEGQDENQTTGETQEQTESTIDWSDFSDSKIKIDEEESLGHITYNYVIENIKKGSTDFLSCSFLITNSKEKPEFSETDIHGDSTKWEKLRIDDNGKIKINYNQLGDTLELKEDQYLWIYEWTKIGQTLYYNEAISGEKLDKIYLTGTPVDFWNTALTYSLSFINLNVPKDKDITRKLKVNIGKINDIEILKKIKNEDSNCFNNLLAYAKNSDPIYSKVLDTNENASSIKYSYSKTGNQVDGVDENTGIIDLYSLIDNDEYYYLYVTVDDENGKYIPIETVTLAYSSKYEKNKEWFLFFFGNDGFKWKQLQGSVSNTTPKTNQVTDTTVAPTILPNTGVNAVIITLLTGLTIVAVVLNKKYRTWKEINKQM